MADLGTVGRVLMATAAMAVVWAADDLQAGDVLIKRYCYECHSADNEKAGLSFQRLHENGTLWEDRKTLDDSLFFVEEHEMPTADAAVAMGAEDRERLVHILQRQLLVLDGVTEPDDPGRVVMARITNTEYGNIIRAISGVDIPAETFIPRDTQAGEGFTNVGEAQPMTAVHVERFLSAATKVLEYARISPVTGIEWSPDRLPPVPTPGHRRKELVDEYVMVLRQEEGGLLGNTERLLAVHLEALWAVRHRGLEPAAAAGEYTSPKQRVIPRSLELLDAYLGSEDLKPELREIVLADYLALDPRSSGEAVAATSKATAALIAGIGRVKEHWKADQPLKIETRLDPKQWKGHESPGDTVYLVLTEGLDSDGMVAVRIADAIFHLPNKQTVSWSDVAASLRTSDGRSLAWKDGAVEITAPAVIPLPLPEGADKATFTARVAEGTSGRTQVYLAWHEPSTEEQRFRGDPIGRNWGEGPPMLGAEPALKGFDRIQDSISSLAEKREYNGAQPFYLENQHFIMFRGFDAIPQRYLEQQAWRGGELEPSSSKNKSIEERPSTPFMLEGGHLIESFDEQGRDRVQSLIDQMMIEVQIPQQDLLTLCREQGLDGIVENRIPDTGEMAGWDADARERFRTLSHAVQAAEADLAAKAAEILVPIASRVWRRPPTAAEQSGLVALYRGRRQLGASFDDAVKQALRAVLAAPEFVYRSPRRAPAGEGIQPLDSMALADRLAATIWGSIPDDQLLAAASEPGFSDPARLRAEAERMMADDQVTGGLASEFAGQWLGFAGFEDYTVPNPERFPEFNADLRERMYSEAVLFFADLFRANRPLENLITADYVFVDKELADHYGVRVPWNQRTFKRTELRPDEKGQRGGIFGMGAVLTKTSTALRTSPVLRGNWIVTIVLGQHIPEPPPVPAISEDETSAGGKTIVEQLMQHREDPACFSCHAKIDPPGIALEHFDPIGRWREQDGGGNDVIATTELSDGTVIDGLEGLRSYLSDRIDDIRRHFCTKLIGYALGRSVSLTDRELIDRMAAAMAADEGRVQAAVLELVASRQFRHHRVALSQNSP